MLSEKLHPLSALSDGWSVFNRHSIVLLGGTAVCAAVIALCAMIPYAKWVLLAAVPFPLLGGLQMLFLNAARDNNPRLADVFSGFHRCGKLLACGYAAAGVWLLFQVSLSMLSWMAVFVATGGEPLHLADWRIWAMFVSALLPPTVLALALYVGYYFAWLAVVDGESWTNAEARSHELAKGRRLSLFLSFFTVALVGPLGLALVGTLAWATNANAFGWPGWCVFWCAMLVTTAVSICSVTATYVRLASLTEPAQKALSELPVSKPTIAYGEPELIGPAQALSEGWGACMRVWHSACLVSTLHCGLGVLGYLAWRGCVSLACDVPFLIVAVLPLVALYVILVVPVMGAAMKWFLCVVRGQDTSFSCARESTRWGGVGWITFGAATILAMPFVLAASPYSTGLTLPWFLSGDVKDFVALATLILAIVGMTQWPYGWFAQAETSNIKEALAVYRGFSKGRILPLLRNLVAISACGPATLVAVSWLVYYTNANAFGLFGWIVLGIGVAFSSAVAMCSMAAVYSHLRPAVSDTASAEAAAA
jgi:hypothetical protein